MSEPMDRTGLLFPSMEVRNKRGEVFFSMKRKGEKFKQLYYLFEIHWDRMDPEEMAKFNAIWEMTRIVAAQMGIPLYDIHQVTDEIEKQAKQVPLGETRDVSIPVLDHATGRVLRLVVGVSKRERKEYGEV